VSNAQPPATQAGHTHRPRARAPNHQSRKKPVLKNGVPQEIEDAIVALAIFFFALQCCMRFAATAVIHRG
jgi:hypothetical protein